MSPLPRHRLLLELDLTEPLAEPEPGDPIARLRQRGRRALRPTLRALHEAAADPRVVGLIARVGGNLSWAAMQELRLGVSAFAESGKPTVAWAESFGEGSMSSYVLATAFGEIWLQPGGGLGPLGVGAETTFLGGALDKLGLEPQLEQRYEYKNAVDRLTRTDFTPPHRESLDALVGSIFDDAVTAMAQGRRLDPVRVRELVDTGALTAPEAHDADLVDRLGYRDEVYAALRERVTTTGHEPELLFADRWAPRSARADALRRRLPGRHPGQVALVEVRGAIVSGRSRRGASGRQVGSDSVSAELRAATEDDQIAAVVLHVDSPGGSAVASDTIWREVVRVRDAGKPVVVAMGDAAASGGYYVACPADVIVALPATLTGSIGVFGGKVVVAGLLDKLGVSTGRVQRGERALMYSARRGFSDDERHRLAAGVDAIYDDFVAKVARGRDRPVAEIEAVARGRVWTGADALGVGLVDRLGGLREAVEVARERAGLRDDAPVRRALRVSPLARLTPARNSEDPRARLQATRTAVVTPTLGTLGRDLTRALGGIEEELLRMPAIRLR